MYCFYLVMVFFVASALCGGGGCFDNPVCEKCACDACKRRVTSGECVTIPPGGGDVLDANCVIITAAVGDVTGTPSDDCIIIGGDGISVGDIDTLQGDDCVFNAEASINSIDTGDGDDCVLSEGGTIGLLRLGNGNDAYQGFTTGHTSTISAGSDDDCVLLLGANAIGQPDVNGNNGDDCIQITNSMGFGIISGDNGADCITISASEVNVIFGGSDNIEAKDGTIIQAAISGGLAPNEIYLVDTVVGGNIASGDKIYAKNCVVNGDITGSSGNDVIEMIEVTVTGSGGVVGIGGDDVISASRTDVDIINGGPGDDKLINVYPTILPGSVRPTLEGGGGNDLCGFDASIATGVMGQNCGDVWDPICD